MNYRDLTVEDLLRFGLNVKVDKLPPLLEDKGVLATIQRRGYIIINNTRSI